MKDMTLHEQHMAAVRAMRIWRIRHRRLVCAAGRLAQDALEHMATAGESWTLVESARMIYAAAQRVQRQVERAQTECEAFRVRCCVRPVLDPNTEDDMADVPTQSNVARAFDCTGLQPVSMIGGVWGLPIPPPAPSEAAEPTFDFAPLNDADAFTALMEVERFESIQCRIDKLHTMGLQLCRKKV